MSNPPRPDSYKPDPYVSRITGWFTWILLGSFMLNAFLLGWLLA